jgi:hypothetical protein
MRVGRMHTHAYGMAYLQVKGKIMKKAQLEGAEVEEEEEEEVQPHPRTAREHPFVYP